MALNKIRTIFRKYPLIVNTASYGCMCLGAEYAQQRFAKRELQSTFTSAEIDTNALKRYAVIGFVINPNVLYFWYKWLDKKFVGTASKTIVKKVLLDQFCMSPPLYAVFYTSMSLMEGKEDIFAELKAKFVPTFQTSCMFWLPATTINFLLIPSNFRVVYVGVCSFAWINILCYLKRQDM